MSVSPISTSTGTTGTSTAAAGTASSTVSLTDFMQLLSTEMQNQDPLQPMDPTQTMTQLAQFTSLQQMTQMGQTQGLSAANSYLGLQVSVPGPTTSAGTATTLSGVVTGIDTSGVAGGSVPQLIISGLSQEYPLTSVISAQPYVPSTTNNSSSTNTTSSGSGN